MIEVENVWLSHLKFSGLRLPQSRDHEAVVNKQAPFIQPIFTASQPNSSTTAGPRPVERLAAEKPGEELAPDSVIWQLYVEEAKEHDQELVNGKNRNLDVMLVFAALFSAILTAFIIDSKGLLQQDPTDVVVLLLLSIAQSQQRIEQGNPQVLPPIQIPSFSSTLSARWINGLWYTSLALSLAAALISMLAKEWLDAFVGSRPRAPHVYALQHYRRLEGLIRWRALHIIDLLPAMMHLSLLLFSLGLVIYLWTLDSSTAITMAIITAITLSFYVGTTILGAVWRCPFVTQISRYVQAIFTFVFMDTARCSSRTSLEVGDASGDTSDMELHTLMWLAENARDSGVRDCAYQALSGLRLSQISTEETKVPEVSGETHSNPLSTTQKHQGVTKSAKLNKRANNRQNLSENRYALLTTLYDIICQRVGEARANNPRELAACRGLNVARYAGALPPLMHALVAHAKLHIDLNSGKAPPLNLVHRTRQLAEAAFNALDSIWSNDCPEFHPDSYAILVGAELRVIETFTITQRGKNNTKLSTSKSEDIDSSSKILAGHTSLSLNGQTPNVSIINIEPQTTENEELTLESSLLELRGRYSRMLSRASFCLSYHNNGYAPIRTHALAYLLESVYRAARCSCLNPNSYLSTHQPQSKSSNKIPCFYVVTPGTGSDRYLDAYEIGDEDNLIAGLIRIMASSDIEANPQLEYAAGRALSVLGPTLFRQWLALVHEHEKIPASESLDCVRLILDRWPETLQAEEIVEGNAIIQLLLVATISVVLSDSCFLRNLPIIAVYALYQRSKMTSGFYPMVRATETHSDIIKQLIKSTRLNYKYLKPGTVDYLLELFSIKSLEGQTVFRSRGVPSMALSDFVYLLTQQPNQIPKIKLILADIQEMLEEDVSLHFDLRDTYTSLLIKDQHGFGSLISLLEIQEDGQFSANFIVKAVRSLARLHSVCQKCGCIRTCALPGLLQCAQIVVDGLSYDTENRAHALPFFRDIAILLQAAETEAVIMASNHVVVNKIYSTILESWSDHEEFGDVIAQWKEVKDWADPDVQLLAGLAYLFDPTESCGSITSFR